MEKDRPVEGTQLEEMVEKGSTCGRNRTGRDGWKEIELKRKDNRKKWLGKQLHVDGREVEEKVGKAPSHVERIETTGNLEEKVEGSTQQEGRKEAVRHPNAKATSHTW